MRYTVSMAIDARLDIDVEAENPEAAREAAMEKFLDCDLKNIEMIGWKPVNATDENDVLTDYD